MPKKKYYPGYANGGESPSRSLDFLKKLLGPKPRQRAESGLALEGLAPYFKEKYFKDSLSDLYGPPLGPRVPDIVMPRAAHGGGVASLLPGYQEGGNPDRNWELEQLTGFGEDVEYDPMRDFDLSLEGGNPDRTDRETYRLDRFMDLVGPRKGMLGRVANKTPQGDPRNPLMKAVLHAASPTLYPSMASPMIVDALADMIPGTMPEGWPGSMYNDADRKVPGMPELRGGRSDQDYLDSIVGSGIGNLISGMVPGGREGYSPGRFARYLKGKLRGSAHGGGVARLLPGYQEGGGTTTDTYNVNPNIAQPMANMTDRIATESQRQYQPSPNQRLAGPDAATQTANLAQEQYSMGPGPAGTQQASSTFQNVGTQAQNIGNQMANPMQQSTADLSGYMSQYTKGVTDPQLDQLREFQQVSGQNLSSQAAGSGNLGGMRQGVQQAQINQNVNQQAANIIGQGQQDAFQSAQQAFQGDRTAQQTGQQNALQAQQLQNQVGQNQMQLGSNQQNQQRQRFGDLRSIGKDRQQTQQQSLNLQEQDRMNAMNQERQNIDWAQNAYNKLPYQSSVTRTTGGTGGPGATPGQNTLATGVGGLGAYNQFQNNYGNNQGNNYGVGSTLNRGNTGAFGSVFQGANLGNVANRSYGGK